MKEHNNNLKNSPYVEKVQTIFDLSPDELDLLIEFRKLDNYKQDKILEHINFE